MPQLSWHVDSGRPFSEAVQVLFTHTYSCGSHILVQPTLESVPENGTHCLETQPQPDCVGAGVANATAVQIATMCVTSVCVRPK